MTKSLQTSSIIAAFLLTGCAPILPNMLASDLEKNNQHIIFKTNQVHFMSTLNDKSNMHERNIYLDEFLLKSDMQCQNYLNSPLKKTEVDKSKNSLYMGIFDTVSSLFGISVATNAAKAVFLENDEASQEEKKAYAGALSPEIRKGVDIGRSRYAKSMTKKKNLNLKAYSINNLREDTLKYDKQCNDAYGLIEINRALKEMQNSVHIQTTVTKPILNIDPKAIKDKVEAASKEIKEKKMEKNIKVKMNTPKVLPTQPKLENVPPRHDNVQYLPRSIQI